MWVCILGAAAGGGFPQWNCNCPNCKASRDSSRPCRLRTQSSIAISADRQSWFLCNASPDIREQIARFPPLWPRHAVRETPIQGVVLSDAELDHTLGLLSLRESRNVRLHATAWVHDALVNGSGVLRTLQAFTQVEWRPVRLQQEAPLCRLDGSDSGLRYEAFPTGNEKTTAFATSPTSPEASVGYRITEAGTDRVLVYLPAVQALTASVLRQIRGCACLLIDGTCWSDDELIRLGASQKTARAMGHLPVGGEDGSLRRLGDLGIGRTIYVHLNNTNPMLLEDSPEYRAVTARGIEIAVDGMELEV
jgi:pyrroloquinoline quinone biosynthesis protein B